MVACESVCVCNWELGVKLSTLPSSAYYCKVFLLVLWGREIWKGFWQAV